MGKLESMPHTKFKLATIGLALSAVLLWESTSWAQFGGGGRHGSQNGGGKSDSSQSRPTYTPLPPPAPLLPHAGDYVSTETNYYEIVYMPLQTRIYMYDTKFKPLSARNVHATMTVQFPLEPAPRQASFQFVPMPEGATEQDYVVTAFDVRPLQDKDVSITFEFSGLKDRPNPTATFTPHYPRFAIRPCVARAALTDLDHDAVTRQRVCPVTGAALASRGPVVKLYVANVPLYVSGEDCIAAVQESPWKFVPQPPAVPNPPQ